MVDKNRLNSREIDLSKEAGQESSARLSDVEQVVGYIGGEIDQMNDRIDQTNDRIDNVEKEKNYEIEDIAKLLNLTVPQLKQLSEYIGHSDDPNVRMREAVDWVISDIKPVAKNEKIKADARVSMFAAPEQHKSDYVLVPNELHEAGTKPISEFNESTVVNPFDRTQKINVKKLFGGKARGENEANRESEKSKEVIPEEVKWSYSILSNKKEFKNAFEQGLSQFGDKVDPATLKEVILARNEVAQLENKTGGLLLTKSSQERYQAAYIKYAELREKLASDYGAKLKAEKGEISDVDRARAVAEYTKSWNNSIAPTRRNLEMQKVSGKFIEWWGGRHMASRVAMGAVATAAVTGAATIATGGLTIPVAAAVAGMATVGARIGKAVANMKAAQTEARQNMDKHWYEKAISNVSSRAVKVFMSIPQIKKLAQARYEKTMRTESEWAKEHDKQLSKDMESINEWYKAHMVAGMSEGDIRSMLEQRSRKINELKNRHEASAKEHERSKEHEQKRMRLAMTLGSVALGATAGAAIGTVINEGPLHDSLVEMRENIDNATKSFAGLFGVKTALAEDIQDASGNGGNGGNAGNAGNAVSDTLDRGAVPSAKSGDALSKAVQSMDSVVEDNFEPYTASTVPTVSYDEFEDMDLKINDTAFCKGFDVSSAETWNSDFWHAVETNPEQLVSYAVGFIDDDTLRGMGYNGDMNSFADALKGNNETRAQLINMMHEQFQGGKVELVDIDTSKYAVYDYGLNYSGQNGDVTDTTLVSYRVDEGVLHNIVKVTSAEGHSTYMDTRCGNAIKIGEKPPVQEIAPPRRNSTYEEPTPTPTPEEPTPTPTPEEPTPTPTPEEPTPTPTPEEPTPTPTPEEPTPTPTLEHKKPEEDTNVNPGNHNQTDQTPPAQNKPQEYEPGKNNNGDTNPSTPPDNAQENSGNTDGNAGNGSEYVPKPDEVPSGNGNSTKPDPNGNISGSQQHRPNEQGWSAENGTQENSSDGSNGAGSDDSALRAEQQRQAQIAEQQRQAQIAEQQRQAQIAEQQRQAQIAEQQRQAQIAEQQRQAQIAEQQRQAQIAEQQRQAQIAEQQRQAQAAAEQAQQQAAEQAAQAAAQQTATTTEATQG